VQCTVVSVREEDLREETRSEEDRQAFEENPLSQQINCKMRKAKSKSLMPEKRKRLCHTSREDHFGESFFRLEPSAQLIQIAYTYERLLIEIAGTCWAISYPDSRCISA
jgi:hypothetical protein